jgi:hypothetical protein
MSTYYSLIKKIPGDDVFDGRLEEFGIHEHIVSETTDTYRCLTDGRDYVWVRMDGAGFFWHVRGMSKILCAVADAFDTDIVSEHQGQFWGFETEEEWDKWRMQQYREGQAEFLAELMRCLSDQPHNITSGTIRMMKAEIAKKLVDDDPSLLLPANQDKLLEKIETTYIREHAVVITLNSEQIAAADLRATHEDDLPQA